MKMPRYAASDLADFLHRHKIATMAELKGELGTRVDMTVFRKLKQLSYRTSYSHGSRYYTLDEIAQFDELGLWSCRSVWFSLRGTLLGTLGSVVSESKAGYFAPELRQLLHVEVKEALLRLVRTGRLVRERLGGKYWYGAANEERRRDQLCARRRAEQAQAGRTKGPDQELTDEVKAALVLFVSLLDEKQRRIYAGLEALKFGPGGERWAAGLLGLHPQTVAKGRRQLVEHDLELERIRKQGGGRKRVEKKRQR